jgi:hypothetical protein
MRFQRILSVASLLFLFASSVAMAHDSSTPIDGDKLRISAGEASGKHKASHGKASRKHKFGLPDNTASRATTDGTSLYIGYGPFGSVGGVRAYILP